MYHVTIFDAMYHVMYRVRIVKLVLNRGESLVG